MTWTPPPTPPNIVAAVAQPATTVTPAPGAVEARAGQGLQATLADYQTSVGSDSSGAMTGAFLTLPAFVDPHGQYAGAW